MILRGDELVAGRVEQGGLRKAEWDPNLMTALRRAARQAQDEAQDTTLRLLAQGLRVAGDNCGGSCARSPGVVTSACEIDNCMTLPPLELGLAGGAAKIRC